MSGMDFIQDLCLMIWVGAAACLRQRLGLPSVIGFSTGGILIGPHTPSYALISSSKRVQWLAQTWPVILIFSIGQGIPLQRPRKVGLPLVLATLVLGAPEQVNEMSFWHST